MSEQLRSFINSRVPFAQHIGVEVTRLDGDGGSATLPAAPELANHVGTQHAGALFTVAETAAGACMLGLVGERLETIVPLARSATIDFRLPARGTIVATATSASTAEDILAELDRDGRARFAVSVELTDTEGRAVAAASVDWHVRRQGS